ncbi:MAG: hypothetical protein ACLQOO_09045 [Terriglobia bacterium]
MFLQPYRSSRAYLCPGENNSIAALDAETGKEVWVHKAERHTDIIADREMNYWEQRRARLPAPLCQQPLLTSDRCPDGEANSVLRHERPC